jgi:hypothetical protein
MMPSFNATTLVRGRVGTLLSCQHKRCSVVALNERLTLLMSGLDDDMTRGERQQHNDRNVLRVIIGV